MSPSKKTYLELVKECIILSEEKKGLSLPKIKEMVEKSLTDSGEAKYSNKHLLAALKRGVETEVFKKIKNHYLILSSAKKSKKPDEVEDEEEEPVKTPKKKSTPKKKATPTKKAETKGTPKKAVSHKAKPKKASPKKASTPKSTPKTKK